MRDDKLIELETFKRYSYIYIYTRVRSLNRPMRFAPFDSFRPFMHGRGQLNMKYSGWIKCSEQRWIRETHKVYLKRLKIIQPKKLGPLSLAFGKVTFIRLYPFNTAIFSPDHFDIKKIETSNNKQINRNLGAIVTANYVRNVILKVRERLHYHLK